MSIKGATKRWGARLVAGLLIPALTGCVEVADYTLTGNLWNADFNADRHFATTNAVPGLFQTRDGKDIMVRYVEGRDRDFKTIRRAYLLYKNEPVIKSGKRPDFVNPKRADKLNAIPVLSGSETNSTLYDQATLGVMAADGQHFTLFSGGRAMGTYALPVYLTADRRAECALLTPVTVVGDVVIYTAICGVVVGVVGGLIYLGLRYGGSN